MRWHATVSKHGNKLQARRHPSSLLAARADRQAPQDEVQCLKQKE